MGFMRRSLSVGIAALALGASALSAQDISEAPPPAHIAFVDGSVTVDREDQTQIGVASMPLVAGDRLRTTRGRAEVLFPDGTALDIDEFSSVELQAPTLLRITNGRMMLTVSGASDPSSAAHFQIDTPTASATTDGPGVYRVAVLSGPSGMQTELAIVRGAGALMTEYGSTMLRGGERSVAWDNAAPSHPQAFNSARFDAFDHWASARRDARLGSTTSAQHLPTDLRMYGGTFDRNGAWQYEAPHGYVWYPAVDAGWRPYYNGYWSSIPFYGWTWVGTDVWTWPTHHYGRWGHSRNRWFWIPDRRWATAWVSWGAAPGYVSWCPLGFDGRPVFALSLNSGNPWAGWVVIPRRRFGSRDRYVHQYAVSPRTLPANTPFVVHTAPPVAPAHAVARRMVGGEPAPVRVAVPRDQAAPGSRQSAMGRPSAGDTPFAVSRQPSAGRRQPPAGDGRQRAGVSGGERAVGRQSAGAGGATTEPVRSPFQRRDQAEPGAFRGPLSMGAPRAIPRDPNQQAAPVARPFEGAQVTHPAFANRRGPAPPNNTVSAPPSAPNTPSRGPIRSPYMLSSPLGPPSGPSARPSAPAPMGAPAVPRAQPRGTPFGASTPAAPAGVHAAPAPQPARAPQAVPRQPGGSVSAPPAPQSAPAPAPRRHDPGSRRPR
jgi:hypothetical protein